MTAAISPVADPGWLFELSPITGQWFGAFGKGLKGSNSVGAPEYKVRIVTPWCGTLEEAEARLTVMTAGAV